MADVIKKATRESYGEALKELADEYKDLVVLVVFIFAPQMPYVLTPAPSKRSHPASALPAPQSLPL